MADFVALSVILIAVGLYFLFKRLGREPSRNPRLWVDRRTNSWGCSGEFDRHDD
jgi:hypothetical protein